MMLTFICDKGPRPKSCELEISPEEACSALGWQDAHATTSLSPFLPLSILVRVAFGHRLVLIRANGRQISCAAFK